MFLTHERPLVFHEATEEQVLEFFTEEMREMLWVEQYLHSAFVKMRFEISCPVLQQAFERQTMYIQQHLLDLKKIFLLLKLTGHSCKCETIEDLVNEYRSIVFHDKQPGKQRDVCLVFIIQQILHFKIAVYTSLVQFAAILKNEEVLALLHKVIGEEKSIDLLLTSIAEKTLFFEVLPDVD